MTYLQCRREWLPKGREEDIFGHETGGTSAVSSVFLSSLHLPASTATLASRTSQLTSACPEVATARVAFIYA